MPMTYYDYELFKFLLNCVLKLKYSYQKNE